MKIKNCSIPKLPTLALLLAVCIATARAADPIGVIGTHLPAAIKVPEVSGPEIWKDASQPVNERVRDLVRRLSLAEKASMLRADSVAIPRLGIPAYSFRNECLHGLRGNNNIKPGNNAQGPNGAATVFPEPIGMGATWDVPLMQAEADVIATEARAKYNDYERRYPKTNAWHLEMSFYSPNINLFRDPRWGRGQETFGEDPFLVSQFGVAYIRGMQGEDPKFYKTVACAKHYAVHSGPEPRRTYISMSPPERDLYETYLPAFEAAVREGRVGSVMGAYSSLDGVPDCENPFLLTEVLRNRWNFQGFVVSDGGAILENWRHHQYEATAEEAAANAVKAGCDLFSGAVAAADAVTNRQHISISRDFDALGKMLAKGLLTEKQIDTAISRTLEIRFRLGWFDALDATPWGKIGIEQNDTPEHRALALKVAEESIVVLKNKNLLPLNRSKIKRIAVIGPNADSDQMLLGNYNGQPSRSTTILAGIKELAGNNIEVSYAKGCPVALKIDDSNKPSAKTTAEAIDLAKAADVVVFVSGIDSSYEREGGSGTRFHGFLGGDRTTIELPAVQEALLKQLAATGKPIVLVNCSGCAMAMPWEAEKIPAIVQAWYPGEEGGKAVAEVLFGNVNPSGRLPLTFYRSTADLPGFEDYAMSNRTYRYFSGKPVFAFGHGLSYTKFSYKKAALETSTIAPDGKVKVSFQLKNSGKCDGDEVVQVYYRHRNSSQPQPKQSLCGFTRVHLATGEAKTVSLEIPAARLRYWDTAKKQYVVEPGKYELLIGSASDNIRLRAPLSIAAR